MDGFDDAVESLSRARTGVSVGAVSRAFGLLADAAHALAATIENRDARSRASGSAAS